MIRRFLSIGILALAVILTVYSPTAHAANASDWKPGRIIDDSVFFSSSAMSTSDIQSFLNTQVPSCDTWGQKIYSGTQTRAQRGASKGYPAPYVCLKDYQENPTTHENNLATAGSVNGGWSAAQIIKNASDTYGISPKALIVLLQKEQGLVTDDWPWTYEYRSATGYGCPDTAPCDAQYYGFYNQVMNAASAFKRYATSPQNYRYKAGQNNDILYNPDSSCGSSSVYLQNQATAGLYIYTPYQPNQAALNNLYGNGDSCSSYGNRNFWRLFIDWFGPTTGTPFFAISGHVYILGANNSYYGVPAWASKVYGLDTIFGGRINYVDSSFVNGMTYKGDLPWIARFDGPEIYAVTTDGLHHFYDEASYFSYGYSYGQEAVLPQYLRYYYQTSTDMKSIAVQSDWTRVFYVSSGIKQHIANSLTFTTTGSPTYSSLPQVVLPKEYLDSLQTGAPIIANNQIVKDQSTGKMGFYTNNQLCLFSDKLNKNLTPNVDYPAPSEYFSLISTSCGSLTSQIVQTADGNEYLVDGSTYYPISGTLAAQLGIASNTYPTVSQSFLDKFTSSNLKSLYRNASLPYVYSFLDGKMYHIASENDLRGLGYSMSDVSALNLTLSDYFSDSGNSLYANGRLLQVTGQPQIYVVDGTKLLRHIPTESLMINEYGYSYASVVKISSSDISSYTQIDPLSRYINVNSYPSIIDNSCRWRFTNDLVSAYGLTSASFETVSSAVGTRINECGYFTNLIRQVNDPKVYLIQNGQKRWIKTEQTFNSSGYKWSDVRVVSADLISSLPSGITIP